MHTPSFSRLWCHEATVVVKGLRQDNTSVHIVGIYAFYKATNWETAADTMELFLSPGLYYGQCEGRSVCQHRMLVVQASLANTHTHTRAGAWHNTVCNF